MPCPAKLPHDLEKGMHSNRMAQWFGPPFNAWYVGEIVEINKRRTKSENVSVKFNDAKYGETRGKIVAAAETYGINKLWVMLEPIPIELGGSSPSEHDDSDDEGAGPPGAAASSSGAAGPSDGGPSGAEPS